MKRMKWLSLLLMLTLVTTLFIGCAGEKDVAKTDSVDKNTETTETSGSSEAEETVTEETVTEGEYADGLYFAQEDEFPESGWKSMVTLEVKDGKIVAVDWNAASKNGGLDKKQASEQGFYPMVAAGGAQSEWHEQAAAVEAYLLETQDPTAIEYKDDEGHTDAISGVSIHVNDFYGVVEKALAAGPQERGPYKDGAYSAEEDEFNKGWKGTVDLTVVFGKIVAVNWSAISEEDPEVDKKTSSAEGIYGMVEKGGAQSEWHEQAAAVEAYLLETQDPTAIEYKDDEGHTDAISGVSIHVNDFYALVEKALASAK